jgi:UDP-N-acetylmuramoyl-tripeptide--D-alanyl-D-alanine ligase
MSLWTISEIELALNSEIINPPPALSAIDEIVIDSRKQVQNGLFIAIVGDKNDGHNFLKQSFENGCKLAIVSKIPDGFSGDKRLILVKDCFDALNKLATYSRSRNQGKIIAITGSSGKTSVKEMLANILKAQGSVFASKGNFNNHFGVPLSLCNMPKNTQFGIFEIGMNHAGEITPLAQMVRPDIAIITNVNSAHIGNFANEEEIALAKSEIFSGLKEGGCIIINADNKHYQFLQKKAVNDYKINAQNVISFGSSEISDIRLLATERRDKNSKSKVEIFNKFSQEHFTYEVGSINNIVIFNSLIAIAVLIKIGADLEKIAKNLENLQAPQGRGNIIKSQKNGAKFTIIDDSYNANSASMQAGLKFLEDLENQNPSSRSVAFIGDMLELGQFSDLEHNKIAELINKSNIDKVLLVGSEMSALKNKIKPEKIISYHQNIEDALQNLKFTPQNDDIIFVKGSRGVKMEKLIALIGDK